MRYESSYERYYGIDPYNPANTLKQHGIIGQKWGVWNEDTRARRLRDRRRQSNKFGDSSIIGSNNSLFNRFKNRFSRTNAEEQSHLRRTHLTKELSEISDEELNAAIKRMQLEQNYLKMLKDYPDASDKGKKYVDLFSDELFKNLSNGLGGAMGRRVAKAIDDWMNDDSDKDKQLRAEVEKLSNDEIKTYNERKKLEEAYVGYKKKEK